jgi:hypothetical protein
MKHEDYKGHKVFCNCNGSWAKDVRDRKLAFELDYDFPTFGECPDCGFVPWYYLDVKYEPKEGVKP